MTIDEKADVLRVLMKDVDPDEDIETVVLEYYLKIAEQLILSKLYPFEGQATGKDIPDRYTGLQIRMAVYMLDKRGAEGENQHIENGIHRNYGSSDIPETMLKEIVPFVKVVV